MFAKPRSQSAAQQARIDQRDAASRADWAGQRAERLERQIAELQADLQRVLDNHKAEVGHLQMEVRSVKKNLAVKSCMQIVDARVRFVPNLSRTYCEPLATHMWCSCLGSSTKRDVPCDPRACVQQRLSRSTLSQGS